MDVQAHPANKASRELVTIYREVLRAVSGETVVRNAITLEGSRLSVQHVSLDLRSYRRVFVLGAGKAACAMAQAMEAILGKRITEGLVVTRYGFSEGLERIRVIEAGHPVPDGNSLKAGQEIARVAAGKTPQDLALVLLSGGASALMELPVEGLTLEDLRATTDILLRSGADINELNAVRRRISRIKAGGLARMLAPARVVCMVISDVLGNPLETIGSGPCWIGPAEGPQAEDVIRRHRLERELPSAVLELLRNPGPEAAETDALVHVEHVILGDIHTATRAARDAAKAMGHQPLIVTAALRGEAREVGCLLGGIASDLPRTFRETGLDCLIFGGEPTVTVLGKGKGGRCQELAASAARYMDGAADVALLAAGTDGNDGPTDAAGGLIDGATAAAIRDAGLSIEDALFRNDSYHLLDAVGALVRTGPTGSNVGDVVLLLYAPP